LLTGFIAIGQESLTGVLNIANVEAPFTLITVEGHGIQE
jgi:hypothetical protein